MNTERFNGRALAAVFSGPGIPIRLEEFPVPTPDRGELLVEITCSTICGSDLHTWHGRREEPTPCILGHEIVGRIVSFGPGAPRRDLRGDPLAAGDRISWTLTASCGECFFCRRGLPQKCETLFKYGHTALLPGREFSGGFAECCLLRAGTGIVRLPEDLPDPLAAPANCAVATVAAAFRSADPVVGATVAVIGCGALGLTACAMAHTLGADTVLACDLDPDREPLARRFGATAFCQADELATVARDLSKGRGADLVLELSGANSAVTAAIATARTGGTIVIAGTTTPAPPIPLDPRDVLRRMLTIKGLHNYAPTDLVTAIEFLADSLERFPFFALQGDQFALPHLEQAFVASTNQSGTRIAVIP